MFIKPSILMVIIACTGTVFSSTTQAEVAVIVNSANAAAISDSDLSRLFLGKLKQFSSGNKAIPVNQKFGSNVRKEFEQKVLKKSSRQVKAYWSKRLFSGKGKPPKELSSDQDIISQVASDKNAIGYVDASKVDGSVKILRKF